MSADPKGGDVSRFEADVDGVTFTSRGARLLGGLYQAAGESPRPTAVLIHGLPGIEPHLDIAYALRDRGWNCLYFHFRGCWGSHGEYSLAHLADDTAAAVEWLRAQPCVDAERVALVGASTGSHPALVCGAADARIRAVVGLSPVIDPTAFRFPPDMAAAFSDMLTGVTGADLVRQWNALPPLWEAIDRFGPRPVLLVAAGNDAIFPMADYAARIAAHAHVRCLERAGSDHAFSSCRPWLVATVCDWLVETVGT
jgi:pimeloyl-ACP methyl ester carboxylesterase